ncbi:MAG: DUF2304 domain-containing protein [Candidatus Binatia bacterium]|nr:DUF2304 domain-containing protein [Candidatus Binatia bacterium]MDG1957142.1 DUF2304 domain-containing protein [Candidatus Binatia bacterium]MDG2011618.1 DUF2304 domain-containing protein [Candidatus Binatia bacterium]
MNPSPLTADTMRNLALSQPDAWMTRVIAITVCLTLLGTVLFLVQRGRLREEYSPIWILVSTGMLIVTGSLEVLRQLTEAIGAWTPSSTLFFFGLLFLLILSLNYAVRLSGMSLQIKLLAQEVALLRQQKNANQSTEAPRD